MQQQQQPNDMFQNAAVGDGVTATWVDPTQMGQFDHACFPNQAHPASGYYRLEVDQAPLITVPVVQEIQRRDKIIEVPQTIIKDKILPKIYHQEVIHEVPKLEVEVQEKEVEVPNVTVVEKVVDLEHIVGFNPKYVPTWEVREVPKLVPKFVGEQKVLYIEISQIQYVDKVTEKEVVVDVVDKVVPKVVEIEEPIEVIRYKWKEVYDDIPVVKYVPKFDVEVVCPAPVIVPYVQPEIKDLPPVKVTVGPDGRETNVAQDYSIPNNSAASPPNSIPNMGNANLAQIGDINSSPFPLPEGSQPFEPRMPQFMKGNMPVNVRLMPPHPNNQ
ncbi:articulin-like protein [Cryptosporidium canis]|uniref:Articulin-like protein n=1 Tax=Cryptosporidium canis TaxID=195482 RepID=A0A9D5DIK0_9CRYT|nr:articulin-like protein [Cryptosporidium canis]